MRSMTVNDNYEPNGNDAAFDFLARPAPLLWNKHMLNENKFVMSLILLTSIYEKMTQTSM